MGRHRTFSREDVLNKAIPVFWAHGLADTTIQHLERATGVNKSGLYAEFKDKNDLFTASLRHYLEVLASRGTLTQQPLGWNNIESFLRLSHGSWNCKGCFAINSKREIPTLPPEARQILTDSAASIHTLVQANIAAAKGAEDDDLTGLILTFFSGICLEQNHDPGAPHIDRKIDHFMRLIRGL